MRPLLLTGVPSVGKTTLFKRVVSELATRFGHDAVRGFLVEEERGGPDGGRTGFHLVTLPDGARQPFAGRTKDVAAADAAGAGGAGAHVVMGRWCVFLGAFEAAALAVLRDALRRAAECAAPVVLVVDEIGKMELLSEAFRALMEGVLEAPPANLYVVCTIALRGQGLVASAKELPGVDLVEVTAENRGTLFPQVMEKVDAALGGR
eukprot:Rhum_TRINITY_DN15579_c0_g1::Rhum_TRINITY_DN15579_c0_g1_i1::g.161319::m.161319/K06928/NTPCR; nucleoside-triphosphatase